MNFHPLRMAEVTGDCPAVCVCLTWLFILCFKGDCPAVCVCLTWLFILCFKGDCPAVCVHAFQTHGFKHTLGSARRLLKFISAKTLFLNHCIKK